MSSRPHALRQPGRTRQQKEDPLVPVPFGPFEKRGHEGQYLVGGPGQRHVSVFFQTQGGPRTPLGHPERKPQKNDISENGSSFTQLRQNWRGEENQKEADIPVQRRGVGKESSGQEAIRINRRIGIMYIGP